MIALCAWCIFSPLPRRRRTTRFSIGQKFVRFVSNFAEHCRRLVSCSQILQRPVAFFLKALFTEANSQNRCTVSIRGRKGRGDVQELSKGALKELTWFFFALALQPRLAMHLTRNTLRLLSPTAFHKIKKGYLRKTTRKMNANYVTFCSAQVFFLFNVDVHTFVRLKVPHDCMVAHKEFS